MGVDFIKSVAKPFNKGWDVRRLELARTNLFTREADCLASSAVARAVGAITFSAGEQVHLRVDGDQLVVVQDLSVTAIVVKPPATMVEQIHQSGGYAKGEIVALHPTLNLMEIMIG